MIWKRTLGSVCRAVAGAAAAAAVAAAIGGCGGPAAVQTSVAIVAGNTANQAAHDFGQAADYLEDAAGSGGWVDVIVCDGEPHSALEGGCQPAGATSISARLRSAQCAEIAQAFVDAASSAQPLCAQTDVLSALDVASRSLAGAPGEHVVLVFSSMLTTSGPLDLAEHPEWIAGDEGVRQAVAEALAGAGLLPDLSGLDRVVVFGAGETAGAQPRPTPGQLEDLESLWSCVIAKSGCAETSFLYSPRSLEEASAAGLPVDVVGLPEAAAPEVQARAVASFGEAEVGFVPDTDQLVDPAAAAEALGPLAEALASDPGLRVALFGSTASCPWREDGGRPLALARARAVAGLLEGLGVDPSRVSVEGLGMYGNEYVERFEDLLPDGTLDEGQAQKNRRVVAVLGE